MSTADLPQVEVLNEAQCASDGEGGRWSLGRSLLSAHPIGNDANLALLILIHGQGSVCVSGDVVSCKDVYFMEISFGCWEKGLLAKRVNWFTGG